MPAQYYEEYLASIEDANLKRSIIDIKMVADNIWTKEVRIIRGFTEHGPEHSERIFKKLSAIISPLDAKKILSEQERYILLLAVILHDIGMQCDVKHNPEMKKIAVDQFDAVFQCDFPEGPATDYSEEEQKDLRRNHHLLTAAWLDYAFRNQTPIGSLQSLKTVPPDLKRDLIDVCRFHSKLKIKDCPEKGTIRTRFLAALLRLGDELDIDRYRVSIDTVKLFGYNVENSLYWYLHAFTEVEINRHLVTLTVRLNENDYKKYETLFRNKIIEEFIKKNRILTDIICEYGIPLAINEGSNVIADRYQDSLPEDICNYIDGSNANKEGNSGAHSTGKTRTSTKLSLSSNTCYDSFESSQDECIRSILAYFCEVNEKALKLKTKIEAVVVIWSDNRFKRRTFYSYNKSLGAPAHSVRDYGFGVVGMLQNVINSFDDNDQRADCMLFYDHGKNPKECEYIIDFRGIDYPDFTIETGEVEEQEWYHKGTKAMLAISLFRQIDDNPHVFGALTFDFAESLKNKGNKQKKALYNSIKSCRDILIPLLVTEIKTDFKDQLLSLVQLEENYQAINKEAN